MDNEILISDIILEYYNNFVTQKKKFVELNSKIDSNLLVYSNSEVAIMINNKIKEKFNKITDDICKLEQWWHSYLMNINDLNSGFTMSSNESTDTNTLYLESKRIYNEELE